MNQTPPEIPPDKPTPPATTPRNSRASRRKRSGSSSDHLLPFAMMGAGLEFVGVVLALTLLGWWLDKKWGTEPWLMIAGLAIGFFSGIYKLWRLGRNFFDQK